MKQTTNLKLNKPDYTDIADVGKLNENSDILDREVNDKLSISKGGNVNGNVTFNGEINMNKTLTAKAIVGECLENAVKENSQKPITSGAVFSGLAEKSDRSHTHENATQSKAGLLSPNDKKKLDSISEGSNKTTVDTNLNSSSSNPVQNKAVTNALAQKSDKNHTHELSDINFTEEKSISLKCVYTYTVHAEGIAPDEGNHIVYWQVVNYTNFPVSSINPMEGYTIGGKTYNLPYIQTITLSNTNPPTFNRRVSSPLL